MTDARCEAGPCKKPADFESTEESRLGPTNKKWCPDHSRVGDVPLDEVRERQWPGHDEPKGMDERD